MNKIKLYTGCPEKRFRAIHFQIIIHKNEQNLQVTCSGIPLHFVLLEKYYNSDKILSSDLI